MNIKHPYLTSNLIAYIGNKRRLLPLINQVLDSIEDQFSKPIRFFDGFAGSGAVSRLARYRGYKVYSNDWETYSYILNSALINETQESIQELFPPEEPIKKVIHQLNQLPSPKEEDQYIAKYYSPASNEIDEVDYKTQRLFFTRENGLRIDAIRNELEVRYPPSDLINQRRKNILLALLIYQVATHNNTSGIFKACHKGFGGYNKDALSRITKKIQIEVPTLLKGNLPQSQVTQEDINSLIKKSTFPYMDIVYLDPPYNQHQYGSNYHLLNTIALWDKPPAQLELNEIGELKEKAAIRKDWKKTKSPYCYKKRALPEFQNLLNQLKAKEILISYSSDGIIPFEKLIQTCQEKGRISIYTNEYTKFRGGRQSNSRVQTNIEFIIRIQVGKKTTQTALDTIKTTLLRNQALDLIKKNYHPAKLKKEAFKIEPYPQGKEKILITLKVSPQKQIQFQSESGYTLKLESHVAELNHDEIQILIKKLTNSLCHTRTEELDQLLTLAKMNPQTKLVRKIPSTLKKLAHKKYRHEYEAYYQKIQTQLFPIQKTAQLEQQIQEINLIAQKRFS